MQFEFKTFAEALGTQLTGERFRVGVHQHMPVQAVFAVAVWAALGQKNDYETQFQLNNNNNRICPLLYRLTEFRP